MNSGTSALEAAFVHALDLQPGDEIILPAFTIISCANAIITHGLVQFSLISSRLIGMLMFKP